MRGGGSAALFLLCCSWAAGFQQPQARVEGRNERSASVGMRASITELVLPGPELEAKPVDLNAAIVLRVTATRPHGSDFRYDLEYYGLEPGTYDLAQFLVRKDRAPVTGLPAIEVEITPVLPPGQIEPGLPPPKAPPSVGGYRTLLVVAGVVWVLGLLGILFLGRRRRRLAQAAAVRLTLADRLRPMVEAAQRGDLDNAGKAELERLLLAYWRRRLQLSDRKAGDAIAALREHDEAGPLLRQLELWLHRPGPHEDVDVATLLAPYRDAPAVEAEAARS